MPQEEGIPVEGTIFSLYGTYSHLAYGYCMNGCNDLCKKDLYELQDGIHGGSRWYCADCAGRHGTSDAFLRQDEEEPSPEPTA